MSFRMCITDKDNQLLRFVEEYGSITISQAKKMYYNEQTFGYDIARKRLGKLVKYDKLKVIRDYDLNQNVYYINKPLRTHDLLLMDFYAELVFNGADIRYFLNPQPWSSINLESDAFIFYFIGNKPFFNIVEIVRTHGVDRDKYHKLFDSNEANLLCNDIYKNCGGENINVFPRMIILDAVQHKQGFYYDEKIKMIQLDLKLTGFAKIFV